MDFNVGDIIKVRHDLWHADLIVGPRQDRLRHSTHQSTANYDAAGDLLWVKWDAYGPELFCRRGDEYIHVDVAKQSRAIDLASKPYTVRADTILEVDILSVKIPGGTGSVFVRPGTSDIPVFDAIFFAKEYDFPQLNADCEIVVDLGAKHRSFQRLSGEQMP